MPKKKPELALVADASDVTAASASDGIHPADSDKPPASAKRIAWAQLLKRVFGIDVTVCLKCSGKIKIIAAPRLAPARGPPTPDQSDMLKQKAELCLMLLGDIQCGNCLNPLGKYLAQRLNKGFIRPIRKKWPSW